MKKIIKSIRKKINELDTFIKISIYVAGGFSLLLVGYVIGRLVAFITT